MQKEKQKKRGKPVTHKPVMNVETGDIFDTYTEAAEAIGGSRFGVYKCAIGIQSHHHGFHFIFVE